MYEKNHTTKQTYHHNGNDKGDRVDNLLTQSILLIRLLNAHIPAQKSLFCRVQSFGSAIYSDLDYQEKNKN